MSKEYPLYPELPEEGKKASQKLIDEFKTEMGKVANEIIGNFYCDVAVYVEEDSWTNYRNEIMDGMCNYDNKLIQGEYDFKRIRKAIFTQFHDEIIKDLNQDMLEENKQLKEQINYLNTSLSRNIY